MLSPVIISQDWSRLCKGVALPNGGCLMISIELTITISILAKKITIPEISQMNYSLISKVQSRLAPDRAIIMPTLQYFS